MGCIFFLFFCFFGMLVRIFHNSSSACCKLDFYIKTNKSPCVEDCHPAGWRLTLYSSDLQTLVCGRAVGQEEPISDENKDQTTAAEELKQR